jgi:hypothetical protein
MHHTLRGHFESPWPANCVVTPLGGLCCSFPPSRAPWKHAGVYGEMVELALGSQVIASARACGSVKIFRQRRTGYYAGPTAGIHGCFGRCLSPRVGTEGQGLVNRCAGAVPGTLMPSAAAVSWVRTRCGAACKARYAHRPAPVLLRWLSFPGTERLTSSGHRCARRVLPWLWDSGAERNARAAETAGSGESAGGGQLEDDQLLRGGVRIALDQD